MERLTDVPESFAQPEGPAQENDYDSFAEAYSAENENNLVNAYYARPAMLALAGDVAAVGSWTPAAARAPVRRTARPRCGRHRHRRQRRDAGVGEAAAR